MRDRSASSRCTSQSLPRAAVRGSGRVPDHVAARPVRVHGPRGPEHAYLRWPATVVTVFWVLCIQVVIVSTWQLLTLVKNDRIFTDVSLVWVNAIVWAIGAAWVVLLGVLFYVGFNADDPGLPLLLFL